MKLRLPSLPRLRVGAKDKPWAVGLALLALAGCGTEPASDGVVELAVLMEPDGSGIYRELFREFHEQNPGIRVQHVEGPGETNTREDLYVASFLSGQPTYDLVFADVVWIPKFAAAGWLTDLSGHWPAEKWDRFIPGSIEGGSYEGRIYRAPTQMNGGLLYYRRDLLEEAGLAPPETLEEMVQIARQLQNPAELWGFVWQGRQYEGLICDYLEILTAFGGYWVDPQTHAIGLNKPEAVNALQFLIDCIHEWRVSPPGTTTYAEEESRQIFHAGRAVFHRNWPYALTLAEAEGSPIRGKVGVQAIPPMPGGRSAATLGGWGFAIAADSPHQEEAWKFIEYITDLPQIERLHAAAGIEPALQAFYLESDDPFHGELREILLQAIPRPPVPQYARLSDILQRYLSAALTRRLTAEEALQRATKESRHVLEPGSRTPGSMSPATAGAWKTGLLPSH